MLPRKQVYQLLFFQKNPDNVFSNIPKDVIRLISDVGFDPNSDIAELLHYIVYGNVVEIKRMLDDNPELLDESGNVETPGGDQVIRVRPYECALGTGDHYKDDQGIEMIPLIASYFDKIKDGEAKRAEQYATYKPYIDNIIDQKPYAGYGELFEIIKSKSSSPADVAAALKKKFIKGNALHDALLKHIEARAPGKIVKGMHYNYANLPHILKMRDDEWNNLVVREKGKDPNYDKCILINRLVFGQELRRLPMCERQALAGGLFDLLEGYVTFTRSLKFKDSDVDVDSFPCTAGDKSRSGLGWDYFVDLFVDDARPRGVQWGAGARGDVAARVGAACFETCFEQKILALRKVDERSFSPAKSP